MGAGDGAEAAPAADAGEAPAAKPDDVLAQLQAEQGATTVNPPDNAPPAAAAPVEDDPLAALLQQAESSAEAASEAPKAEEKPAEAEDALSALMGATEAATKPVEEKPAKAPPKAEEKKAETPSKEEEKKTRRSRKKKEPAAGQAFVLAVNCDVTKFGEALGPVVRLGDYIKPVTDWIEANWNNKDGTKGVAHWSLIPFGDGAGVLVAQTKKFLEENPHKGVLVVDAKTLEGLDLLELLISKADVVIRGTR
jgi:hypothetical protein